MNNKITNMEFSEEMISLIVEAMDRAVFVAREHGDIKKMKEFENLRDIFAERHYIMTN